MPSKILAAFEPGIFFLESDRFPCDFYRRTYLGRRRTYTGQSFWARAYLLTHWIHCWSRPKALCWKATSRLVLENLLPSVAWLQWLKFIQEQAQTAARQGFQISLKPLPD